MKERLAKITREEVMDQCSEGSLSHRITGDTDVRTSQQNHS
jgi:hypothetical protein